MRLLDVEQGSVEWHRARAILPTASNFDRILTPTGKPSTQADAYMREIIAARLGAIDDNYQSAWMERGNIVESEARAFYSLETGRDAEQAGFVYHESGLFGCSPDALCKDRGLEIKCPKGSTHVGYLLDGAPTKYNSQIQGSMLVTGFDRWDFLSYHPEMRPLLVTVERDNAYCNALEVALIEFCERLEETYIKVMT